MAPMGESLVSGDAVADAACPSCGRAIEADPRYSSWCARCGWNADPAAAIHPAPSRLQRLYARISRREATRRMDRIRKAGGVKPRLTIGGLLLRIVSVVIVLSTPMLVVLGVWLILSVGGVVGWVLALASIVAAFALRPTLGSTDGLLPRAGNEGLFALPDRIADELGTRPVDGIAVDGSFNASVGHAGWRGRRVLVLGLPLMAMLEPAEREAILAHEFAHFRNGDPLNGLLGGIAVSTVFGWYELLRPSHLFEGENEESMPGLLVLPANVVLLMLSWIPLALGYLLLFLDLAASQRGEYFADLLAARLASRQPMANALAKLRLVPVAERILQATSDARWPERDLWVAVQRGVATLPASEVERARWADVALRPGLIDTHPPIANRIDLIEALSAPTPSLAIDTDTREAFETALRSHAARVGKEVIDQHRDSLYA
jgi:Zn-dependent protease with chaperone function